MRFGPSAVLRHVHVGRRVRRLDRRDHFEPREPADVVERDHLRMLDPRAQRVTLFLRQHGLERVEHESIAGVSDRVHVQLPALGRRQRRQLLHLLARVHHQAAVVRLIAVVLHQRGAATAECAVGPRFDGAHLQAIVVFGHARAGLHQAAIFGAVAQHGVDANRQATGGAQLAIQIVGAPHRCRHRARRSCRARRPRSSRRAAGASLPRRWRSGMCFSTSSSAVSTSTPVGWPEASRTIWPPCGSGVAAVMPATFSAALFTQTRMAVDAAS